MNTTTDITVATPMWPPSAPRAVVLRGFFADWWRPCAPASPATSRRPRPTRAFYDGSPGKGRHFGGLLKLGTSFRIPPFHLPIAGRAHRGAAHGLAQRALFMSMCW